MQFVLVQHKGLSGRKSMLGQPQGGPLIQPDHLLDVSQKVVKALSGRCNGIRCRHHFLWLASFLAPRTKLS